MPPNKREDIRSLISDDGESVDNQSVISFESSNKFEYGSDADTNNGDDNNTDESGAYVDDFEEKLTEALDGINGKSAKTRQLCLDAIRKALTTRFCYDFVMDRFVFGHIVLEALDTF